MAASARGGVVFASALHPDLVGFNNWIAYEVEDHMDEIDARVAEILQLGAQKKNAYLRLDELEAQWWTGGLLMMLYRALFPSKSNRALREEYDTTICTIYRLRDRMDVLWALLPGSRLNEVDHLWSWENTTSLSQLRRSRQN